MARLSMGKNSLAHVQPLFLPLLLIPVLLLVGCVAVLVRELLLGDESVEFGEKRPIGSPFCGSCPR